MYEYFCNDNDEEYDDNDDSTTTPRRRYTQLESHVIFILIVEQIDQLYLRQQHRRGRCILSTKYLCPWLLLLLLTRYLVLVYQVYYGSTLIRYYLIRGAAAHTDKAAAKQTKRGQLATREQSKCIMPELIRVSVAALILYSSPRLTGRSRQSKPIMQGVNKRPAARSYQTGT